MSENTIQETTQQDISTMQMYIESVSINMESLIETYYEYLQQRDGDDQESYNLLSDFTQKTLNNLEVLQNSWNLIKEKLNDKYDQPPFNNSFQIYFDNQILGAIKSQVDNIVDTINRHAPKYEIQGIVQINTQQSSSELMEIEEGDT
ncbi:unnamed protein product (macronuclear) [Paramecium tetraurelia]|uniref:Uncharacterized protein n=2 Tax=Paramecium TaxID=5884 RepID=A0D5B9_PARTE|nr:uncharacterized protein GSPATT00013684001 [Paramecium tetraurelia]CAD8164259.1 unnamed protein product [Paramecium octaurelia]CAK78236.1 unnamed protein product [Paramecium tetraurelia]|eukprot:XP_001445633.1 hypothetical protein (macronuclear) [Paramecium tetraurelia strain d4-2]